MGSGCDPNGIGVRHAAAIGFGWGWALALTGMLVVGCASGPDTGVRAEFEDRRPARVAVVPFYSTGSFGLSADERQLLFARYEQAAEQKLRDLGFDPVNPDALRGFVVDQGYWDDFGDGIPLRQSLTEYFETEPSGRDSIEIRTLRQLAAQGAIPADTLLFAQVVYHSEGICRTKATDHVSHAELAVTPDAPSGLPRPCVTSHFHAKLVDTTTGDTMWYNRSFLETHTDEVDDDTVQQTIVQTVRAALGGDDGAAPLALPGPESARPDSN